MTTIKTELNPVPAAYENAKPLRETLSQIGKCMEVTEDKAGIVWERWLVGKSQIVLFATPHFAEVFAPLTDDMTWEGAAAALRKLASD